MGPVDDLYSPPDASAEGLFLGRYRRPLWPPVVERYVSALTDPADLVFDPFCQDATPLRVAVAAGRRAVAITGNPLLALLTRVEAAPPSAGSLMAALHRIHDAPKVDAPLGRHIDQLYATPCTQCGQEVTASAFIWERDGRAPILREYTCQHCRHQGREPQPEGEADRLPPFETQGFHRRLVAGRMQGEAGHRRLQERLLDLYTPRNLYALTTLLLKIELLFAESSLLDPLRAALLHTLDVASKLNAVTEGGWRPVRSLEVPRRFREANVWRVFEQAVQAMAAWPPVPKLPLAASLEQALREPGQAYIGAESLTKSAARLRGNASLILLQLPRFDPSFAALSYLWSAWLLGREGARAAGRLLGQRSPEDSRYLRALRSALAALVPALKPQGRLALLFQAPSTRYLESLMLAASGAGLHTVHTWHGMLDDRPAPRLGVRRAEHHLVFATSSSGPAGAVDLQRVGKLAVRTAQYLLSERAEPAPFTALHGPLWDVLAQEGVLARGSSATEAEEFRLRLGETVGQALDAGREVRPITLAADGEQELAVWWLASPPTAAVPLSDRVEASVRGLLLRGTAMAETDLMREILQQFRGVCTPSWPLLLACFEAYGQRLPDGRWVLRDSEEPSAACERSRRLLATLEEIGRRLGYQPAPAVAASGPPALVWLDDGKPGIRFVLPRTAELAPLRTMPAHPGRPVLVIPQGHLALWRHKLRRLPVWAQELEQEGWAYLGEQALYGLAQEMVDRARFAASLDPVPPE